ncbi:MAG: DJ-1/PfpI family protein [Synechococcales cyanobacterium]
MVALLLPLAPNFEEIEAVTVMDIVRRAGINLTVAALSEERLVTGSHGIPVYADTSLSAVLAPGKVTERFQGLVLPGGPGTRHLQDDHRVVDLVRQFSQQGYLVAAICAAPTVLAQAGLLASRRATSYFSPDVYECAVAGKQDLGLVVGPIGHYSTEAVVVDGPVITSRGAGTAVAFALEIVACLLGIPQAQHIAAAIHAVWHPVKT